MKKINKYCVVLCMCERRAQTNENSSLALTVKFALPLLCECSLHMFECECVSVCAKYIIICMTRRRRTCPMDHWNKQNRSHRCSHWQQCQKPRWVPNELPPTNDPLLCRKTYLLERILLHLFTQFRRGFPLAGCNIVDRSKCVTALVWVSGRVSFVYVCIFHSLLLFCVC